LAGSRFDAVWLSAVLERSERTAQCARLLHDDGAAVPLTIPRQTGETDLAVREVKLPKIVAKEVAGRGSVDCP
jgi:hypothetical protein